MNYLCSFPLLLRSNFNLFFEISNLLRSHLLILIGSSSVFRPVAEPMRWTSLRSGIVTRRSNILQYLYFGESISDSLHFPPLHPSPPPYNLSSLQSKSAACSFPTQLHSSPASSPLSQNDAICASAARSPTTLCQYRAADSAQPRALAAARRALRSRSLCCLAGSVLHADDGAHTCLPPPP